MPNETNLRIVSYMVLASGIIPIANTAEAAGPVGKDDLNIVLDPFDGPQGRGSDSATLDLGPGFGSLFQFDIVGSFATNSGFPSGQNRGAVTFTPNAQWDLASYWYAFSVVTGFPEFQSAVRLPFSTAVSNSMGTNNYNRAFRWKPAIDDVKIGQVLHSVHTDNFLPGDWVQGSGYVHGGSIQSGYLGFRLRDSTNNDFHYGWIDITYNSVDPSGRLTINGYGVNTTPNETILTGQIPAPGAVGLAALAMGAAGIRRHRRAAFSA